MAMTEELQKKLADLCVELNTQDNRITAHPLFIVEQEKRIYGMDSAQVDDLDWIWSWAEDPEHFCEPDAVFDQIRQDCEDCQERGVLNLWDEEIDPEEWGYEQWFYVTEMEFKCAHLTEKAADLYIAQNSHNLHRPRVYVTSQYRCYEWNMVREHLMAKPDDKLDALEIRLLTEGITSRSEIIERLLKDNARLEARLKASKDREKEEIDINCEVEQKYRARSEQLALEVEMLRRYGNKDCTAQADEALLAICQATVID